MERNPELPALPAAARETRHHDDEDFFLRSRSRITTQLRSGVFELFDRSCPRQWPGRSTANGMSCSCGAWDPDQSSSTPHVALNVDSRSQARFEQRRFTSAADSFGHRRRHLVTHNLSEESVMPW